MSQHSLRIALTDGDRPVKILDDLALPEGGVLVVATQTGEAAQEVLAAQPPVDVSQLDFELPGIGRVETRRHRHPASGEAELLVIELESTSADLAPMPTDYDFELLTGETPNEHFLTKPMLYEQLQEVAAEAKARGYRRIEAARQGAPGQQPILGDSEAMCRVLDLVERVAASSASVFIGGETGTGKTLVARRIHDLSLRAEQRFVAINCSAFQDQLLESELFGHEKGAFTGASAAKQGLFEVANGGTIFLDEVGDMSSSMQAKLLQVLDEGQMRRVGGRDTKRVNVRVIAATNKDIQRELAAGNFREDLLFRLRVIDLKMPPLRDRRDDIPKLIEHFLDRYRIPGRPRKQLSPEAMQTLSSYDWRGNVRELANTIEGLTLLAPGDEIRAVDLPPILSPRSRVDLPDPVPLPMHEVERIHFQNALEHAKGNKAAAARLLGVDRKTLSTKIMKYELDDAP